MEEARTRAALGVAALDQLGIDKGFWLVAGELAPEDEHWESPHTKLVDERWLELILAKLRDIHDFQDKKQKLTSSGRKSDDSTGAAEKDKEKDTKKKKKEEEEKTAPQA